MGFWANVYKDEMGRRTGFTKRRVFNK